MGFPENATVEHRNAAEFQFMCELVHNKTGILCIT